MELNTIVTNQYSDAYPYHSKELAELVNVENGFFSGSAFLSRNIGFHAMEA